MRVAGEPAASGCSVCMQIFSLLEISADYTEAYSQLACSRLRRRASAETLSRIFLLVISRLQYFTGKVSRSLARRVFHSRVSAVMPIGSRRNALSWYGPYNLQGKRGDLRLPLHLSLWLTDSSNLMSVPRGFEVLD